MSDHNAQLRIAEVAATGLWQIGEQPAAVGVLRDAGYTPDGAALFCREHGLTADEARRLVAYVYES